MRSSSSGDSFFMSLTVPAFGCPGQAVAAGRSGQKDPSPEFAAPYFTLIHGRAMVLTGLSGGEL